jgi:hypothetical protein
MYAVFFHATFAKLDDEYFALGPKLRILAEEKFGCTKFISVDNGKEELSISYWPTLKQLRAWRDNPQHQAAMAMGRSKWYAKYSTEVVEVLEHNE